jgi:protein phosphatase
MGCTLAGICLMPDGILLFHCGDSRIYYYNSNMSRQLSSDDTIAQLAVNVGRITAEEARHLTQRHHLTNFLGYEKFTCQIKQLKPLRTGDHLLICSDGIHDLIEPNVLDKFLSQSTQSPLAATGRDLAQQALNHGGDDNLSLILMQLSE